MQTISTTAPIIQVDSVTMRAWRFFTKRCQEEGLNTTPVELEAAGARVYSEFKQELLGLLLSGQNELSIKNNTLDDQPGEDMHDLVAAIYVAAVDLGFGIFPPKSLQGSTTQIVTLCFFNRNEPPGDVRAQIVDLSLPGSKAVKTT